MTYSQDGEMAERSASRRIAVRLREAEAILQRGEADAVGFGRWFSSNPDLPERFRRNAPLTPYERDAFWGGDEHLYIDFPALAATPAQDARSAS